MHSVCFNQLKIALIGFVLLLSLTACKNSQDSMAGKETESNTEKIIQLAQTKTTAKSDSETERAVFKPTVPEDDKYYYMIVDSYLVRIGKENQQMELLCFDSNCTHPRTEQCKAYIPQLTEYTVEDRGFCGLREKNCSLCPVLEKRWVQGKIPERLFKNIILSQRNEVRQISWHKWKFMHCRIWGGAFRGRNSIILLNRRVIIMASKMWNTALAQGLLDQT